MPVIFPSSCSCFFYQAFRVFGGGFSGGGQVLVSDLGFRRFWFPQILDSGYFGFLRFRGSQNFRMFCFPNSVDHRGWVSQEVLFSDFLRISRGFVFRFPQNFERFCFPNSISGFCFPISMGFGISAGSISGFGLPQKEFA